MELGYVTFSAEEQQLVHNVLQQLMQGAIDELGLGRIRDTFSDLMFPGMSTLHRKSKYFVLLPALYDQLAKTNITERKAIAALIRQREINMTISLLNYANDKKLSTEGITGNSIGIDGLRKGQFVKIRPTSIYLSSLKFFGLVNDKMNLTDLIWQQSCKNHEAAAMGRRTKNDEDPDENDGIMGIAPNFFPFPSYDFGKESSISLSLTSYEAQVLKDKIIGKCCENGHDNLFSYILKNDGIKIESDFFDMKTVVDDFPAELKKVYYMAFDFSKWAHLMNAYYRYAFYLETTNEEAKNTQKKHIDDILGKGDYPSKERIAEILSFVSPMFNDVNGLCTFCKTANECIDAKKEDELIKHIADREKKIKGNYYKIGNDRYKNTNFEALPGYYTYRWNEIVYSMINDIRNPQP